MNEKKSLNFDFLDEKPTAAGEKSNTPIITQKSTTEVNSINFSQYFKECFTNFSKFAKENLTITNPKYLLVAIWVFGMGNVIDRITSSDSSNWGELWAIVIFGGILSGGLTYYIGGWFYHVRMGWSKGTSTIDTARNIYTFSSLPIAVVAIGSLIFNQIAYGSDYFNIYQTDASNVDMIFGLLSIVAIAYSIYISYKAVMYVARTQKSRAIWWFIVAPAIFYILIFISAIFK